MVHVHQAARRHIPECRNLNCIISLWNSLLEAFYIRQHKQHRAREILGIKDWGKTDREMSRHFLTYFPNNLPWETKESHRWTDITIVGFLAEITSSKTSWIWRQSTAETRRKRRDVGVTKLCGVLMVVSDVAKQPASFALCPFSGDSKLRWTFKGSVQSQVNINGIVQSQVNI